MIHKPMPILTLEQENTFWSHVDIQDPDSCWDWQHSRFNDAYGCAWISPLRYLAHRIAYYLHYEKDPGKFFVCHSCDNPPCCNPFHLWLGTNIDNMQDARDKNRFPLGEDCRCSKLTEQQVLELRIKYSKGQTLQATGDEYGLSSEAIGAVVRGEVWPHVGGPITRRGARKGSSNGRSKLTEQQVLMIRIRHSEGETQRVLASDYDVSNEVISSIITGTSWKHVDGPIQRRQNARGESHPHAKLTEQQVLEIRIKYSEGQRTMALAAEYGVTDGTIYNVVRNRNWKHVGGPVI